MFGDRYLRNITYDPHTCISNTRQFQSKIENSSSTLVKDGEENTSNLQSGSMEAVGWGLVVLEYQKSHIHCLTQPVDRVKCYIAQAISLDVPGNILLDELK